MKRIINKLGLVVLVVSLVFAWLSLSISQQVQASETSSQAQSGNLLEDIKKRGVIRMGLSPDYPPYEFIVQENGKNTVKGIDVSVGQKIADDLGVKLEIVEMEFSSLLSSLEAGNIDMIISGMSVTPERQKSVDFSKVYEVSPQVFVIRKSDQDKFPNGDAFASGDLVIGVQQGTMQEQLVKDQMPQAEVFVMSQVPDLINALSTGQIDGVLMDETVGGAHAAEQDNLATVLTDIDVDENNGKAVVAPKGESELVAAINQSIDEIHENNLIDVYMEDAFAAIADSQQTSWLDYWPYFWSGLKTTLFVSLIGILVGTVLGSLVAILRLAQIPVASQLATFMVEFIRGTPLMIQVLFMFLGVGGFFGISALTAGLIAISINSGAYVSEIIRGGLQAVDKGQTEAARSLGLNQKTTMQKIIFPQALRSIWPSLGNEFITLIKESSIISTIGVAELTFQTRAVTSISYRGIIPLLISMVLYFILTFLLGKLLNHYERRMNAKY
ncbi:amino acid ABC transporter [Aerococcus urinaehominis]|uniref:Amino acid ABC transporter n=1 Tax=Aerococcus urinaehominis TaxID=128944 RepID=A0A0X8FLR3_9LACT|nr:ABC transporter substrate-binding protein/permease [Aerococcus urinaehominis]AMB99409.1 amino acid ABC transporter [Aerococcus urinaehominis]SDM24261.1 amino acid ABC transporter substrate-binding protein, PAAT family (TC 3.A.1.3.-)/amino acid ABC transporter membrane protein, PAAT family (TC 3.A.1.3.-) [Aerococcus urinaehominis]